MGVLDSLSFAIIAKVTENIFEYKHSCKFYWYIGRVHLKQGNYWIKDYYTLQVDIAKLPSKKVVPIYTPKNNMRKSVFHILIHC